MSALSRRLKAAGVRLRLDMGHLSFLSANVGRRKLRLATVWAWARRGARGRARSPAPGVHLDSGLPRWGCRRSRPHSSKHRVSGSPPEHGSAGGLRRFGLLSALWRYVSMAPETVKKF